MPAAFAPIVPFPHVWRRLLGERIGRGGDKVAYPIIAGNDEDKVAAGLSTGKSYAAGVIHSSCRANVLTTYRLA